MQEAGVPVAYGQAHAFQTPFQKSADERLPARGVLLHALIDADDLTPPVVAHADGDQHRHVLDAAAPAAFQPDAVHEHIRERPLQRPVPPFVDVLIDPLQIVGEGLGRHPVAPQLLADRVDLTRADPAEVHLHERLLDARLARPVALDHRRLEQGALELGHSDGHAAGLHRQLALVMAGEIGFPAVGTLVPAGPGDPFGVGVEHRVQNLLHLP